MNETHTVRVQLPDGTLVKIEGGSAEDTAHFLANRYLTGGIVTREANPQVRGEALTQMDTQGASEEEPLGLPILNFDKLASATPPIFEYEEQPLELPRLLERLPS
jgi:hypothetical protein